MPSLFLQSLFSPAIPLTRPDEGAFESLIPVKDEPDASYCPPVLNGSNFAPSGVTLHIQKEAGGRVSDLSAGDCDYSTSSATSCPATLPPHPDDQLDASRAETPTEEDITKGNDFLRTILTDYPSPAHFRGKKLSSDQGEVDTAHAADQEKPVEEGNQDPKACKDEGVRTNGLDDPFVVRGWSPTPNARTCPVNISLEGLDALGSPIKPRRRADPPISDPPSGKSPCLTGRKRSPSSSYDARKRTRFTEVRLGHLPVKRPLQAIPLNKRSRERDVILGRLGVGEYIAGGRERTLLEDFSKPGRSRFGSQRKRESEGCPSVDVYSEVDIPSYVYPHPRIARKVTQNIAAENRKLAYEAQEALHQQLREEEERGYVDIVDEFMVFPDQRAD